MIKQTMVLCILLGVTSGQPAGASVAAYYEWVSAIVGLVGAANFYTLGRKEGVDKIEMDTALTKATITCQRGTHKYVEAYKLIPGETSRDPRFARARIYDAEAEGTTQCSLSETQTDALETLLAKDLTAEKRLGSSRIIKLEFIADAINVTFQDGKVWQSSSGSSSGRGPAREGSRGGNGPL